MASVVGNVCSPHRQFRQRYRHAAHSNSHADLDEGGHRQRLRGRVSSRRCWVGRRSAATGRTPWPRHPSGTMARPSATSLARRAGGEVTSLRCPTPRRSLHGRLRSRRYRAAAEFLILTCVRTTFSAPREGHQPRGAAMDIRLSVNRQTASRAVVRCRARCIGQGREIGGEFEHRFSDELTGGRLPDKAIRALLYRSWGTAEPRPRTGLEQPSDIMGDRANIFRGKCATFAGR